MATKSELKMHDGRMETIWQIGEFSFLERMIQAMMPAKDLDLQLKWMKETEIRDDDVILCAYPKTGTHWLWEILNMVQKGTVEYQKDSKAGAMLEFCTQDMTSSLSSPRVLNTHFSLEYLPAGIIEKKCKIIHVMRNPKDVVVSYYHHLKELSKRQGAPEFPPFEIFAKVFRGVLGLRTYYCSYIWYIKTWEQFQEDNPDYPLLNVFYEDLKRNPEGEIRKIAKFLGRDIDDAMITAISDKCNFNKLKREQENKDDSTKGKIKGGSAFLYRKGTIGDWKNHLTVAENEEYDKWLERELKDSKLKFVYE